METLLQLEPPIYSFVSGCLKWTVLDLQTLIIDMESGLETWKRNETRTQQMTEQEISIS
jgi:hypothetical protein